MRILIYLAIAIVAAYMGYKIAEVTILNKQIKSNVQPIVDELRLQLTALQNSIQGNISPEEKAKLEAQKQNILSLLAKFYGYTTDELNAILNKAA
jgi:hypothetical protein